MSSYQKLLQSPLWEAKRHWVMRLDYYHCRECGKAAYNDPSTSQDGKIIYRKIFMVNAIVIDNQRTEIADDIILINEESLALNVHHKFYINGKKPWEYPDDALVTLCPECHRRIHEKEKIPVFNSLGSILHNTIVCTRCSGYGYIPEYYHVESGVCFKCWGEGVAIEQIF